MTRLTRRYSQWAGAVFLAAVLAGCQESDVVAPDGATISLTANPATIVLVLGVQAAPVTIIATVYSTIGVPLPGQDIRFTTTAGTLTPTAGTPVDTDEFGNATTVLTDARQPPTITAKSGKATQTLQLQTATCLLADIAISPSPVPLDNCNDPIPVTAVATDTSGRPCGDILVNFASAGTGATTDVAFSFSPGSDITDPTTGAATTTLNLNSTDCNAKCVNNTCTGSIKATSGTTSSTVVLLQDNI